MRLTYPSRGLTRRRTLAPLRQRTLEKSCNRTFHDLGPREVAIANAVNNFDSAESCLYWLKKIDQVRQKGTV